MNPGEPSGPIQLIPPGLLGLLQIKSPAGQNPNVLNADVQPTLEMLDLYLRTNQEVWGSNSGVTVAVSAPATVVQFSPNAIVVPAQEWWYVHHYSVSALPGAGGFVIAPRLGMLLNRTGTIRYIVLGPESYIPGGGITSTTGAMMFSAKGFWMPPGSELGMYISDVQVADVDLTVRGLVFTRCRI